MQINDLLVQTQEGAHLNHCPIQEINLKPCKLKLSTKLPYKLQHKDSFKLKSWNIVIEFHPTKLTRN